MFRFYNGYYFRVMHIKYQEAKKVLEEDFQKISIKNEV
jgi:hypothetical protein